MLKRTKIFFIVCLMLKKPKKHNFFLFPPNSGHSLGGGEAFLLARWIICLRFKSQAFVRLLKKRNIRLINSKGFLVPATLCLLILHKKNLYINWNKMSRGRKNPNSSRFSYLSAEEMKQLKPIWACCSLYNYCETPGLYLKLIYTLREMFF